MDREKLQKTLLPAKQASIFTLRGLNQLLWPSVCINCRQSICENDNGLCHQCWSQLITSTGTDYCPRCGKDASRAAQLEGVCPDCQGKEIHFDQIARAGIYSESLKTMILAFKKGKTELNKILGFLTDSALQGSGFKNDIELFVPVPLHWSRRLLRGYNQPYILIKQLRHSKSHISTDLVRIRRTKFQTDFDDKKSWASKRAANVAGAFAVRKRHNFPGRNICLVDDIKTTGATLNECARTLKNAGAAKVFALVLAVAGQKL